ncbi:MAG: phospholipase A [Chitinophagales bacterium]|jgi:hypothetical protein|nr:phospholipase A [Bacteroidota bacterium]MBP8916177.1 phospholipase A [Chitinophagales bacterium]MBP9220487.1 phospholipase A [Chitinophagales bacterium]
MKIKVLISFFLIWNFVLGQTIPEDDLEILQKRISNKTFLNQTLNYSNLSYVSPPFLDIGNPKSWYILSADISPQFVIGGSWMKFPIHLTPRYKVRIFHENPNIGDTSLPVRTPSYMPGASIYIPLKKINENTLKLKYLSISFFHHSNGQDGNEFDSTNAFNLYNGNFKTNFFEPAFHFRNRILMESKNKAACKNSKAEYFDLYGKLGIEKHINTAEQLKNSYGDYRLNFTMGLIRVRNFCDLINGHQYEESYVREKYRIVLNSTAILGSRTILNEASKRINLNLNYHWRIPSSPNTSLFIGGGYFGSDTYNIYYSQNYFYLNAGLSLGFFVTPNMIGLE